MLKTEEPDIEDGINEPDDNTPNMDQPSQNQVPPVPPQHANLPQPPQQQQPPAFVHQQQHPPHPVHPQHPHQHQQHPHQQQHQFGHHAPPDCTIWMGDLCPDWDASYIREAFGQYGKDISNVKMVTTDQGARKATYCFVEFGDEESARNALLDVNGKPFPNDPSGRARFNLAFANSPHHMSTCILPMSTVSSPLTKKPPPPVPPKPLSSSKDKFRPITPTETIIGSLWDDINRELDKYKEEKKRKRQIDSSSNPSSPLSHSTCSSQYLYKNKRDDVEEVEINGGAEVTDNSTINSISNVESISDQSIISQKQQNSVAQEVQLKHLHDLIVVQQDQICQASRALAFCRQNDQFRGGREEVDAQRALLIATERRRALLLERDRVINGKIQLNTNEPKGTLTFSSISIRLSREYVNNCAHGGGSSINRYYFIVLIKCGEQIFHTSLASSDSGIKTGFIEFTHYIPIEGLSPDFICELETYSLKASQEKDSSDRSTRSKKGTWRRMVISTPLTAYTNTFNTYSSGNSHRPIGVMDPGFQRIGHLTITRQLIGRQKFLLNDTAYPLDGSCLLSMDCHSDLNSTKLGGYSSFLSLYQIVSGFGAWNRFWCVLGNGQLNFWRYPEDEATKNPTVTIELVWCITSVTALPSSSASFPNSMQVDVVPPQQNEGDKKEGVRMLFAADSSEERDHWLENINKSIRNVNIWRPIRRK